MISPSRRKLLGLVAGAMLIGAAFAQEPPPQPADTAAPETPATPTDSASSAEAAAHAAEPAAAVASEPAADAAGTAKVVFFRAKKFTGSAKGFMVREKGVELGRLRSGTYFVANVAPGTHEFTVHSEAKDLLTMEVEAG
jgi:hypothetical protein